jgi:chitodextrinase
MQDPMSFVFPASPTAYTLTGIEAEVNPAGTGFAVRRSLLLDYALTPALQVPAGVTVFLTVNSPLSGFGSMVVSLGADGLPPTAPVLTVIPDQTTTAVSWSPSTDNVGVAGYILERATGTVSFAQIAFTTGTTFADSGLTLATVYSYRVKAMDAAGNSSPYSNVAMVTTQTPAPPPPPAGTVSNPGDSTPVQTGVANSFPQLVDSTGAVWILVAGKPFRNGVATNNPYTPNISYLFVSAGNPIQIRSQNKNGTYACWTGTAWGC